MTTAAAPPADQKIRLPDEIWPGINAMMHSFHAVAEGSALHLQAIVQPVTPTLISPPLPGRWRAVKGGGAVAPRCARQGAPDTGLPPFHRQNGSRRGWSTTCASYLAIPSAWTIQLG